MDNMEYKTFGHSKLKVSEYCLGTLTMGRLQSNLSIQEGAEIIKTAVNHGITFIDTAANYGSINHIKQGLELLKNEDSTIIDDLVIATKTKAKNGEELVEYVDVFLNNLNRDIVDILCFHNIASKKAFEEREDAYYKALELKDKGKIKEIGWTAHSLVGLEPVLDYAEEIGIIMPIINFKGVGLRGYTLEELLDFLDDAKKKGISTYSMKSLGGGHLRSHAEEAINWLRNIPQIDVVCVGAKSSAEVIMNACIFEGKKIPVEISDKIERVRRKITIYHHLCEKCGKCIEACTNGAMIFTEEKGPEIDHDACVICGYCADACPKFIIRVI